MNPMQKLLMMVPSPMYRRPQSSCGTKRQRFISTFSMLNGRPTSSANRRFSCTDGVVAQTRELEHCNADADDDDARNHAKDAPQGDFLAEKIHVQNAFLITIRILYSTIP